MATKKKATKAEILAAWQEAKPIKGKNPKIWRKDEEGNLIRFSDYEKSSQYSWEIS